MPGGLVAAAGVRGKHGVTSLATGENMETCTKENQ